MNEDFDTNLSILKEMILDEQKIVTYVSLSKELSLHVNMSKSLLQKIVRDIRNSQPKVTLNVSYILAGIVYDSHIEIDVCLESNLLDSRKKFKTIFYEHIYSVSTGSPLLDLAALSLTNPIGELSLCKGIVRSDVCVKQPIEKKIFNSVSASSIKKVDSNKLKQVSKSEVISMKKAKTDTSADTIHKKSKDESDEKLNNLPKAKTEPSDDSIQIKSKEKRNTTSHKPQKSIAGFFSVGSNLASKTAKDSTFNSQNSSKTVLTNSEKCLDTADDKISKNKENISNQNPIPKYTNKKVKTEKNRKRVVCMTDSEDESENDDVPDKNSVLDGNISEDEIPPSPIPDIKPSIKNPRKKRKVIEKTYTDEDGYILTKKEEIFESCSDEEISKSFQNNKTNEASIPSKESKPDVQNGNGIKINSEATTTKEEIKISKNTKKRPQQKGKQSVMTNFFKKS